MRLSVAVPQDRTDGTPATRRVFTDKIFPLPGAASRLMIMGFTAGAIPPGSSSGKKEETRWKWMKRKRRSGKSCPFV
jgi:hypothetical protein